MDIVAGAGVGGCAGAGAVLVGVGTGECAVGTGAGLTDTRAQLSGRTGLGAVEGGGFSALNGSAVDCARSENRDCGLCV